MLRIIVACLILNIKSNVAEKDSERYEHEVTSDNNIYSNDGAFKYHLDVTKPSLNGKKLKVIINLLEETESPNNKILKKHLEPERSSRVLVDTQHLSAIKKKARDWSAFRRSKEKVENKPTSLSNKMTTKPIRTKSPTLNKILRDVSNIIQSNEIRATPTLTSSIPMLSLGITKQHDRGQLQCEKISLRKVTRRKNLRPLEWSALRHLKEKFDETTADTFPMDETAFTCWRKNVSEDDITVKPAPSLSTDKSMMIYDLLNSKKNTERMLHKKLRQKTKKITTELPELYDFKKLLLKRTNTETPLTSHLFTEEVTMQRITKRNLQRTKGKIEKTTKPTVKKVLRKVVKKRLLRKKGKNKSISKVLTSTQADVTEQARFYCWNGETVTHIPIVKKWRREKGKVIYKEVNNVRRPFWVMEVRGTRTSTTKKVVHKKNRIRRTKNHKGQKISTIKTFPGKSKDKKETVRLKIMIEKLLSEERGKIDEMKSQDKVMRTQD